MLQAPQSYDEVFKEYLQDLPEDYREMAIQCKAFTKPRKIRNPTDLLLLNHLNDAPSCANHPAIAEK